MKKYLKIFWRLCWFPVLITGMALFLFALLMMWGYEDAKEAYQLIK